MILIIDNYDSFTYNLVQYIGSITPDLKVVRNDRITIDEIKGLNPGRIVISPGPGLPEDAGISVALIRELGEIIPIFGICLGHQAIAVAFDGKVVRAPEIVHGKTSDIHHENSPLFAGIPKKFHATRYHSLIVEEQSLPAELKIIARTKVDGLIMGVQHRQYPVFGVQFHPESIVTEYGLQTVKNFLEIEI